jgi:hypothetical protein
MRRREDFRHSKIESTVRYHGVEIEDALALAESTEISQLGLVDIYVAERELQTQPHCAYFSCSACLIPLPIPDMRPACHSA